MPSYDYLCEKCDELYEIRHSMTSEETYNCPECDTLLIKQLSATFYTIVKEGTIEKHKESENKKKVKDFDRAVKMRKKAFGKDSVGDPNDKPDPRHIIKRGKTLGGQQMEVDKGEFIKRAAKDIGLVKAAENALRKEKK